MRFLAKCIQPMLLQAVPSSGEIRPLKSVSDIIPINYASVNPPQDNSIASELIAGVSNTNVPDGHLGVNCPCASGNRGDHTVQCFYNYLQDCGNADELRIPEFGEQFDYINQFESNWFHDTPPSPNNSPVSPLSQLLQDLLDIEEDSTWRSCLIGDPLNQGVKQEVRVDTGCIKDEAEVHNKCVKQKLKLENPKNTSRKHEDEKKCTLTKRVTRSSVAKKNSIYILPPRAQRVKQSTNSGDAIIGSKSVSLHNLKGFHLTATHGRSLLKPKHGVQAALDSNNLKGFHLTTTRGRSLLKPKHGVQAALDSNNVSQGDENSTLCVSKPQAADVMLDHSYPYPGSMKPNSDVKNSTGIKRQLQPELEDQQHELKKTKLGMQNRMEQERRLAEKKLFLQLKEEIPTLKYKENVPKIMILTKAIEFCDQLRQEYEQSRLLRQRNRILRRQIHHLRCTSW